MLTINRRMASTASNAAGKPVGERSFKPVHGELIEFTVQEQDHVEVHIPARRRVVNNFGDTDVSADTIGLFIGGPTRPSDQRRPAVLQAGPKGLPADH